MKKWITILALLLTLQLNAQSVRESFEDPSFPPAGWQLLDGDADGNGWKRSDDSPSWGAIDGSHVAYSESVVDGVPLNPNNFLSLTKREIPSGVDLVISFWVGAGDAEHFAEKYSVVVNTSPRFTAAGFAQVLYEDELTSAEFKKVTIPIPESFWGRNAWIAIRHYGGESLLKVDDFRFEEVSVEKDAELLEISRPNSKAGLSTTEPVRILIKNNGNEPLSDFTVSFDIDGNNKVTETIAGPIEKDAVYEYTFTAMADLSVAGTYTINASIDFSGDEDLSNNDKSKEIISATPDISLYGYSWPVQDFISFDSALPLDTTILAYFQDEQYYGSRIQAMEYVNGDLFLFSSYMNQGINYPGNFFRISGTDWSVISKNAVSGELRPNDMTYDYSTNRMYAVQSYEDLPSALYTFDLETGQITEVAGMDSNILAIACKHTGQLYGIDSNGTLYTIDKQTGSTTLVGETGLALLLTSQSMAFDHNTGRLFFAITGNEGGLVEINPETANVTSLGKIGGGDNQISGLHTLFMPLMANSTVPANRAIHQETDTPIAVTFNKNISAGNLNRIAILDAGNTPVTGVAASVDGNVLTILHDDFAYDTEYTVTIYADAINDLLGPISWSFTTKLDPSGCFIPTEIAVVPGYYDADISWRSDGRSEEWEIRYGRTDEMPGGATTIKVDSNPYTLLNLDNNTSYSFYIRGLCSENEETAWTEITSFQTLLDCDAPISILNTPFFEGFEEDFLPPCWTAYYQSDEENVNWTKYDNVNKTFVHSGEASARHYYGNGTIDGWLITPQLAVPEASMGSYVLEFWSYIYYPDEYRKNSIMVSKGSGDPADGDFTEVWTLPTSGASADWQQTLIGLTSEYAGQNVYIAFRYESESSGHVWYLDDVFVKEVDALHDAGVAALKNPVSGGMLSSEEPIVITIINNGKENITELPVTLKVGNQIVAQETITGINLENMQTYDYTFVQTINMSDAKSYAIEVSAALENDENPKNDILKTNIKNEGEIIIMGGKTPIAACGVKFVDNGGLEGNYNQTTGMQTMTIFPAEGDRVLAAFSKFRLNERIDDAFPGDTLFIYNGSVADPDHLIAAWTGDLNETLPYTVVSCADDGALTFVFKPLSRYSGVEGWEADITCGDLLAKDVAVTAIVSPRFGGNAETEVNIKVANWGANAIDSPIPVALDLNGVVIKEIIPAVTLLPTEETEYTFNAIVDLSIEDIYTLKVYTELEGDMNSDNDMATVVIDYKYPVMLYGYRLFDGNRTRRDLVAFSSNSPEEITVVDEYKDGINSISGGEFFDKHLYLRTRDGNNLGNFVKLSTENWTEVFSIPVTTLCTDMAYDYSTGTMFATGSGNIFSVDMETGNVTTIKQTNERFVALACDLSGQLFAVNTAGDFFKVNKANGDVTVIGATGFSPTNVQSMAFDHNTGRLFWAMYDANDEFDDTGLLVEIDPLTGEGISRGRTGNDAEIVALYSIYDAPLQHVSTTPSDGATEVGLEAPISVTFNKSFPSLDLTKVSINPDPGHVEAVVAGQYLDISHDKLAYNTEYTVSVPSGTIVGYPTDIVWSFTTEKGVKLESLDNAMVALYPNPVEDYLKVEMNTTEPVYVTIYSLLGEKYLSEQFMESSFSIDLSNIPSGVMMIKLTSGEKQTVRQIIKK